MEMNAGTVRSRILEMKSNVSGVDRISPQLSNCISL